MHLTPRDLDKLVLHGAGFLAQKRLARGLRLNHPEAVALAWICSSWATTSWAMATIRRPTGVIASRRLRERLKMSTPSSASSSLICLLIPGCEVRNVAAAAEMFRPLRETSLMYRSCCRFIGRLLVFQ